MSWVPVTKVYLGWQSGDQSSFIYDESLQNCHVVSLQLCHYQCALLQHISGLWQLCVLQVRGAATAAQE